MVLITSLIYLCWRVIDGDLDGLAGGADVDHHQDVTVTDLKGGTNGGESKETCQSANK